jgi:hypothetical protein
MFGAVAASLVLSLTQAQAATVIQPPPAFADTRPLEAEAEPERKSALWVPAGAFGLGGMFAGIAGVMTEAAWKALNHTTANHYKTEGLIAMSAAMIAGAIPGGILGNEARSPSAEKTRNTVVLLDVAGAMAFGFGLSRVLK